MHPTRGALFLVTAVLLALSGAGCTKSKKGELAAPQSANTGDVALHGADANAGGPVSTPQTVGSGSTTGIGTPPAAVPAAAAPAPPAEKVLNLYIWPEYTSAELLQKFTAATGIRVVEANYASNEELLAKLQAGAVGYDVAVPSDYMVQVMAKLAMLKELDKTKIPNLVQADPRWLKQSFDAENKFSLPYAWTITGIAVNRDKYQDPVSSWADLLMNDKAKGRISMLDDVRESLGAALKLDGRSLNATKPAWLDRAKNMLKVAKKNIKTFSSTPADLLTSGEVYLAQMYSQEALVAARDSGKKIEFVIPKEGATIAIDNMVILKDAPHVEEAHAFINFLLDSKINAAYVERTFSGPVVKDVKAALPKALQENQSLFPPEDVLARCEMMQDTGEATVLYDRIWTEVKASSH